MTQRIKTFWVKTSGYKTVSAGVLSTIFLLLKSIFGKDFMSPEVESAIITIIEILGTSGILHKIWKDRKIIIDFIKNIFKKKGS